MATKQELWGGLPAATIREAYEVALEARAAIVACMTMKTRGEGVEFWIGGPGEEVHGVATALAFDHVVRQHEEGGDLSYFVHYRSDALVAMNAHLRGYRDNLRDYFRQALSRRTDPNSSGRQMVMHLSRPDLGIMPFQSPVGMQLGKAAGYARGLQLRGRRGLAVGIVGDGTTGESDFHEACMAGGLWNLPMIILVTDNRVAISVKPEDGRGIRDYGKYAEAFGIGHFTCDGHDFQDTYRASREAAEWVLREGKSAILVANVPRLMGHSSSSGGQFDFKARDPLLEFGSWLVDEGLLLDGAVFRRGEVDRRKSYFEMHRLGSLMERKLDETRRVVFEVRQEPTPSIEAGDVWRFSHPPFPEVTEPKPERPRTRVQINEALNLALHRILEEGDAAMWGQDVGDRGGIFQVSAGLKDAFPDRVRDAPINEPMIVGTAMGAALHKGLKLLPEIQFGDYTLNCLHWFVHLGNLYWTTHGQCTANVTLRTPVDPVNGGAVYHSMSVDGFYGNVPGLVLTIPSTAFDAYGLLRTAADYEGPVLQLEPKRIYRMKLGPSLPGEPTDAKELSRIRRSDAQLPIEDYRVPFGKAAKRRDGDGRIALVGWGWSVWQAKEAADAFAKAHGVEAEVWDLRTLVPYDRDQLLEIARRTGRVLLCSNDRLFQGFARQVQADLLESVPGAIVRAVGQLDVPAVGQARVLEDAITLQVGDIGEAMAALLDERPSAWLDNDLHWLAHAPGQKLR